METLKVIGFVTVALGITLFSASIADYVVPAEEGIGAKQEQVAAEIPLVFDQEFTGFMCDEPPLPGFNDLEVVAHLPDPFKWSDNSGYVNTYAQWKCRRAEIKRELEAYIIGKKPGRPENITASYSNDTLTVNVTVGENTLRLTSAINVPSGEGPFPAIIGIGRGSGSLPREIFSERDIVTIAFNFRQVMQHTQKRGTEPINQLYPELTEIGAYSAWSWGVSRIIDGLELVADELPIDLKHIGITGCSFAGKMALWAGALDERIALTIAQEPGGGGAAAWRVSETLGNVERVGSTNYAWFLESMRQFANENVSKLPVDHHELVAMVAPRALLVLGNPDYEWLAEESSYVSCNAAGKVWAAMGIPDRFGYSIVGGHGHCALPANQYPEVEAFVDKFLLGDTGANTLVAKAPDYASDLADWIKWDTPELR